MAAPKPVVMAAPPVVRATAMPMVIECKRKGGNGMAKLKTRKATAKRFKVTASGKVICRHAGKQHLNEKMSKNQKRRLSREKAVFAGDVRPTRSPRLRGCTSALGACASVCVHPCQCAV